ncbi:unnamed protein product [Ixodes hexagonus]
MNGEVVVWTVSELVDTCYELGFEAVTDEASTRDFIQEWPHYFDYDWDDDTVGLPEHSITTAIERCLVEFVALQLEESGSLDMDSDDFEDFDHMLPRIMTDHIEVIYDGSLQLFVETHLSAFTYINDSVVELAKYFKDISILADETNVKAVSFFRGVLQKIGATEDDPCPVHTLNKYCKYMEAKTREFLFSKYSGLLNMFFLINCHHFETTGLERCSVHLTDSTAEDYIVAVYLKEQLRREDAFTYSTGLTLEDLLLSGEDSELQEVRSFFSNTGLGSLRRLLKRYPNIFRWQGRTGQVCLRGSYCPWQDEWVLDKELAVAYFINLLRDIGATSPSNPICFNYILQSVQSAPAECRSYLKGALPGLDAIDLFHLRPTVFDLSAVNCVSLSTADYELEQGGSDAWLSACYAARLLKYVPDLTPDLLRMCAETAAPPVLDYCIAPVGGRLQSVIDEAEELEL